MSTKPPPAGVALLKPSDVAVQLGVSRSWLYEAAKTGRIPSIRIGGEEGPLRFVPADIQEWIDDARAAWTPGRPTVPTRHLAAPARRVRLQRPRSAGTPVSGQQTLL
jgi:excisionase family DNA binding protein